MVVFSSRVPLHQGLLKLMYWVLFMSQISPCTAMVAGGCQVVVFTTGRGTPTGHAIAPVLKVTANRATFQNMIDNMDIDVSGVTEGEISIEDAGAAMLDELLEVCNGKTTKAEAFGFSDIAIDRICRFI